MIGLRIHSKRAGMHVHAAVFVSEDGATYAFSGILSMRETEYQAFRNTLAQGAGIQKLLRFEEICDLSEKPPAREIEVKL